MTNLEFAKLPKIGQRMAIVEQALVQWQENQSKTAADPDLCYDSLADPENIGKPLSTLVERAPCVLCGLGLLYASMVKLTQTGVLTESLFEDHSHETLLQLFTTELQAYFSNVELMTMQIALDAGVDGCGWVPDGSDQQFIRDDVKKHMGERVVRRFDRALAFGLKHESCDQRSHAMLQDIKRNHGYFNP